MKKYFFFFFISLIYLIKSNDFSFHFTRFVFSGLIIVIKVGKPVDTTLTHVSMDNNFSYFEFTLLNGTRSKSVKIINESLNVSFYSIEKSIDVELREDIITFPYFKGELNYSFYFMKKKKDFVFTSISLAHKFNDVKFSLIDQLFNNKYIDKKRFGLYHIGKSSGEIFFGDHIKYLNHSNQTFSYIINVNPDDIRWSFNLNMICFKNYTNMNMSINYLNSYYAFFNTAHLKIFVPKDFFDFLIEKFFKVKFEEESCYINDNYNHRYKQIICKKMSDIPFENLTIVIDGIGFDLGLNDLYENWGYLTYFLIEFDTFNPNSWSLGTTFLLKYTTIFDYDSHTIKFYSDKKLDMINYKSIYFKYLFFIMKKYLIYSTSIINFIGILLLIKVYNKFY